MVKRMMGLTVFFCVLCWGLVTVAWVMKSLTEDVIQIRGSVAEAQQVTGTH